MIKKRPSLPIGYSLDGQPPVLSVLHSDDRCELYNLSQASPEVTKLLLLRRRFEGSTETLTNYWLSQDPLALTVLQPLTPLESLSGSAAAVLELRGRRLLKENFTEAKEEILKRVFRSMLDLIDRAHDVKMFPDFDPSLTWISTDETAICTLLPLSDSPPSEVELVRLAAGGFYRIATGIQIEKASKDVPLLQNWSKYSGEELSRIVERCLSSRNPKVSITTWAGLNNLLGRSSTIAMKSQDKMSQIQTSQSISAQRQGLDKVAGMNTLKALLRREVVAPIRNPEPYRRYGLSIPNGILLYGPPGCGKTYIARQLAEELGHYFVEIIPSELASPYVHQSVNKIREIFEAAAEQAPAVMFIDEFEALVPPRGDLGGHQQHKAEEVNEFLAHLNGCSDKKIFVIAATNQPDKIDPAVRRTGRLDKLIYVGPPDAEARKEMLAFHLEGRPIGSDLDIGLLAEALDGYSASDLRFLIDEAARDALRGAQDISQDSFRTAMARVHPSVTQEIEIQYRSITQRGF